MKEKNSQKLTPLKAARPSRVTLRALPPKDPQIGEIAKLRGPASKNLDPPNIVAKMASCQL
jgi:hypothetical protein